MTLAYFTAESVRTDSILFDALGDVDDSEIVLREMLANVCDVLQGDAVFAFGAAV
jgi:hypothetical protein